MTQRLKLVKNPSLGSIVFVSPHVPAPYSGMCGQITRVESDKVVVRFAEDFFDEFPKTLLMELEECQ